ncbi:MAG: hypothetical protein LBC90_01810 [Candidatus Adiutrix sp.]|jgi:hypothetical protein|nr:hypothetical protein [Candidatus Adiutrix sp.]
MPSLSRSAAFSPAQTLLLDRACLLARTLVAEDFRLDFEDFRAWPVDVKHLPELAPEELAEGVFAQLFRYFRPGPVVAGARPDYYRICLYDPEILRAVAAEPGLALEALLTYVLTHEFIHVARFVKFMGLFEAEAENRRAEEKIVHEETFRLLSKISLPGLDLVLDLYRNHRLPVD